MAYRLEVKKGGMVRYIRVADTKEIDDLSNHISNKSNPHEVTAAQVGALTQLQADDLYFRQDNLLSEVAAPDRITVRNNIALGITDDVQFANIRGTSLRTDTGKFHSPVDYAFRNAGDTAYRTIAIAQATGVDHAVAGGREITLSGDADGVVSWNINTQNLTANRTWTPTIANHGLNQRGVVSTGTQNIYGRKQFQNESQFLDDIFVDRGQVWDNNNSFITTSTFLSGFAGNGLQIERDGLGHWSATLDNLTVRRRMTVYELFLQQLRAGRGNEIFRSGMKAESVEVQPAYTAIGDISTNIGDITYPPGVSHHLIQEEDLFVPFSEDDLIRQQTFTGREIKLIEAIVLDIENGSITVTDNTLPRYARISVESGSDDPANGDEFVAYGNRTDLDRQGFVGIFSEDTDAPYMRIMNGITSRELFGSMDTMVGQFGRLDGITDPDFSQLDGLQQNLYGVYTNSGFFNNVHVRGTITILDDIASNAATKSYVDNAVGQGEGNVTIRSATEPTERPGGAGLATGDVWIKTDDGDLPHTWDGTIWVRSYTKIDGGNITTGNVDANRMQANVIAAIQATIDNLSAIVVNTGALTVNNDITMSTGSAIANGAGDARFQLRNEGFVVDYLESGTWKRSMSVGSGGTAISKSLTAFPSSAEFDMFIKLPSVDPVSPNQWYWKDFNNLAAGDMVVCISDGTETPPSTPAQPTVCKQSNALIIEWNAVAGADTYDVQRSVGGGAYADFATGVTGTEVSDTDPFGSPDTTYQYRVRACNSGGCSTYSTASTSTTFNTATAC